MSAAHTPGPWWTDGNPVIRSRADKEEIADLSECERHIDEVMANARLIAAAPELLAGCKAALGAFERNDCINWDDLRRAIDKAEGRS